jgi:hypothetical protein
MDGASGGFHMPDLRNVVTGFTMAALAATITTLSAAGGQQPWKEGSTVVLTACVERAQGDGDEFILTNVVEVIDPTNPGARLPKEPHVYWLDDTDDLEDRVGAHVRITGKLTDVDKEEMEVKREKGVVIVEIDDLKVTPQQAGVAPPRTGKKEEDRPYWRLKLDVQNVEIMNETCRR